MEQEQFQGTHGTGRTGGLDQEGGRWKRRRGAPQRWQGEIERTWTQMGTGARGPERMEVPGTEIETRGVKG